MRYLISAKAFWFSVYAACVIGIVFLGQFHTESVFAAPPLQTGGGCPAVCADGYYNGTDSSPQFVAAESYMSSAIPQVRNIIGYSGLRVGIGRPKVGTGSSGGGFIELGWEINPIAYFSSERFVYATWCNDPCSSVGSQSMFQLTTNDYTHYTYTVQRKNTTKYLYKFNGTEIGTRTVLNWDKGWSIICGGETDDGLNAIGVADCLDVSYKKAGGSWTLVPSHAKRVTSGYTVYDYNGNSWQVYGGN